MNKTLLLSLIACLTIPAFAAEDERPIVEDTGPRQRAGSSSLPTIWIAGDSTVNNRGNMAGWGQEVGKYFDPKKVNVVNRAIGGRSSRTFYNEDRWKTMLAEMKKGDILFVQFGHNDVGAIGAAGKHRGSLKSDGDETEEDVKPDGTTETVHSYGWYLRQFANEAKEKGATTVIFTPVPHQAWKGRKLAPDFESHRKWAKSSAAASGAHFVDLTAIVSEGYEKEGAEKVAAFFADPRTHTNQAGAEFNARCVIAGLKGLPNNPVEKFLSSEGRSVPAAK